MNQHVMVIILSKKVKEVAHLLIRTLHLCKVHGNIDAVACANATALIGDKDFILHRIHAGRALIGQAVLSLESCRISPARLQCTERDKQKRDAEK